MKNPLRQRRQGVVYNERLLEEAHPVVFYAEVVSQQPIRS